MRELSTHQSSFLNLFQRLVICRSNPSLVPPDNPKGLMMVNDLPFSFQISRWTSRSEIVSQRSFYLTRALSEMRPLARMNSSSGSLRSLSSLERPWRVNLKKSGSTRAFERWKFQISPDLLITEKLTRFLEVYNFCILREIHLFYNCQLFSDKISVRFILLVNLSSLSRFEDWSEWTFRRIFLTSHHRFIIISGNFYFLWIDGDARKLSLWK